MKKMKNGKSSGRGWGLFDPKEIQNPKQDVKQESGRELTLVQGQEEKNNIVPLNAPEEAFDLGLSEAERQKILKIEVGIESLMVNMKSCVFEFGKLLSQAKGILSHGAFQRWIEQRWKGELAYSTAHRLMTIYDHFHNNPNTIRTLPSPFLFSMTQKDFPDVIKDMVEEHTKDLDRNKIRAIQTGYQELKKGNISKDEFVAIAKDTIALGAALKSEEVLLRTSLMTKRIAASELSDLKARIKNFRKYIGEARNWFPAADEKYSIETEEIPRSAKVRLLAGLTDKELVDGINYCIGELNKLKTDIEGRGCLLKKRLTERNGVIKEDWTDATAH